MNKIHLRKSGYGPETITICNVIGGVLATSIEDRVTCKDCKKEMKKDKKDEAKCK